MLVTLSLDSTMRSPPTSSSNVTREGVNGNVFLHDLIFVIRYGLDDLRTPVFIFERLCSLIFPVSTLELSEFYQCYS